MQQDRHQSEDQHQRPVQLARDLLHRKHTRQRNLHLDLNITCTGVNLTIELQRDTFEPFIGISATKLAHKHQLQPPVQQEALSLLTAINTTTKRLMHTCGKLIMRTGISDSINLRGSQPLAVSTSLSRKQLTGRRKSYLLRTCTGSTSKYGRRMSMLAYRLKALEA